jgi:hypothetical protein
MPELKETNIVSKFLLALCVLYAAGSIVMLLLWLNIIPFRSSDHPYTFMTYAIVSFGLTLLIAGYHLFTIFIRRKRKDDDIID